MELITAVYSVALARKQTIPTEWPPLVGEVTSCVVWWSQFLAADPEVPGSISGATGFYEKLWTWNRIHSAS
jgi:hypothetical protein